MQVTSGVRLGPYQVVDRLGVGGMGEVWRARDTRLERSVALKILPAEFAGSAELKLRFEREAKAISQLSHPHICSLFDVGSHDEVSYLVMELLEGETLADRLSRGPLPMDDVLRLGAQIADALAAAHRHDVIHRDLKPGNIMLTKAGAKLLDFGLAKSAHSTLSTPQSALATEQKPLTAEGAIVGTFQYMAPEQIEGSGADARTDIFALGAVLYEMATGVRAFSGKTRTSVIAAIVSGQPRPISELQPVSPAGFEHLVRGCLEKDPDDRLQSARDVAMQLRWIAAGEGTARSRGRSKREWIAWASAALLAVAFAAGAVYHLRTRTPPAEPIRFTITPPDGTNFSRTVAISPDGRQIVFRAGALHGPTMLWLRSLDSLATKQLAGTENAFFAFWSPDSRHIGFIAPKGLRRLNLSDGTVRTIAEGSGFIPSGASWSREGVIVFSRTAEDPLHRVSAEGGEQVPVATLQKDEKFHLWPWFLPDGQHFLFTVAGSKETSGIYVGSIRSKLRKKVASTGVLPHVTPVMYSRGHIFYIRNSRALVTQPFDVDNLEVRGEPVVIDDEIEFTGPGRVPMSVSESGMLVYRKAGAPVIEQLAFVDRTGREGARVGKGGPVEVARFSPDGRRLLISYRSPLGSIWVHDLERGTETKMTFEPWATLGAWIDDESFAFSAATDAPPNLFLKRSQGDSIRLTNTDRQQYVTDVSPDGRFVVYVTDDAQTSFDLQAMPITPPHDSIPLVSSPAMESNGRVSPDGRWLAYTSNESGRAQVYVTAFPKAGRRWQISTDGASIPLWSADGRELYYDDLSGRQLMAVKIERSGSELRPAKPQVLFPLTGTIHDVDSLGRFLIGTPHLNPDSPPLTIVANWQPPGQ